MAKRSNIARRSRVPPVRSPLPLLLPTGAETTTDAPASVRTDAFRDFYREHAEFALRLSRRLGVDDAALDDVVQQVFLVAYRHFLELRPEDFPTGSVKGWLFAIVIRVVREYRRTTRRKSPHFLSPHTDPETLGDSRLEPHQVLARNEAAWLVRVLLEQLDEHKRQVLVLSELERWTIGEIAEAFGISVHTVASRRRAARRAFKQAAERYFLRDTWRLR
jgi:RNA polymerase sigma-70 factor, ECF subfamily